MGAAQTRATEFHILIVQGNLNGVKKTLSDANAEHRDFLINSAPEETLVQSRFDTAHPLYTCCNFRLRDGQPVDRVSQERGEGDGQYDIASYLLEKFSAKLKFDAVNPTNFNRNAFHLACERLDLPMIKLFLKYNYPILQQDAKGLCPFSLFAKSARDVQQKSFKLVVDNANKDAALCERIENAIAERSKVVHLCIIEFLAEATDFPKGDDDEALKKLNDADRTSPFQNLAEGGFYEAVGELVNSGYSTVRGGQFFDNPTSRLVRYFCRMFVSASVDPASEFVKKRLLQTLRVLLTQEGKELADDVAFDYRLNDYAVAILGTAMLGGAGRRYSTQVLTDEEIARDECNTLLYELVVNHKYDCCKDDGQWFLSMLHNTPIAQENAVKLFGKDGFYSKISKQNAKNKKRDDEEFA